MKAFACDDARGVYLEAVCIVFAETEEEARNLLYETLQREGLWENMRDTFTLKETPMIGAHVLWNGDY